MDIWYNYVYLDPRKPGRYEYDNICFLYEPIYVGKGKNNRKYDHIKYFNNNNKKRLNTILYNKLTKIYSLMLEPIIIEFNYTNNEKIAYDNEKILILNIGTIDGETENIGPLCNFCLDNRPPNHKGKTYEQIYGKEKALEQLQKRAELQNKHGGYFKGRKHTDESKLKISNKVKGINNPCYGKEVSRETRNKIGLGNKGKRSKRSLNYIFKDPNNKYYLVNGSDINEFCNINNISKSTLEKRVNTNTSPISGKTKDWMFYHYDIFIVDNIETEIISYVSGAVKQDVNDQSYEEFSF